jgi:hypothetical protein
VAPWELDGRLGLEIGAGGEGDEVVRTLARALAVGLADVLGAALEADEAAPATFRVTWPRP